SSLVADLAPPGDGAGEALLEADAGLEAEALPRPPHVETAPRLPVRLARVEREAPAVAHQPADELRQVADADLAAEAEVHRVGAVVALGGQHDPLGAVLDVEELARGRPVTPDLDGVAALLHRSIDLPDQRRDHVRGVEVEVVARA